VNSQNNSSVGVGENEIKLSGWTYPEHLQNRFLNREWLNPEKFTNGIKMQIMSAKAAMETDQKLDSLVYTYFGESDPYVIETYQYNDNGDILLMEVKEKIGEKWETFFSEVYIFNESGVLTGIVTSLWDDLLQELKTAFKLDFTYNEEGFIFSETSSSVLENEWFTNWKVEYYYNNIDKVQTAEGYFWTSDTWKPGWLVEYTYNENGAYIADEFFIPDADSEWKLSFMDSFTYDEENKLLSKVQKNKSETGVLVNSYKTDFDYDDNNNPVLMLEYEWNMDSEKWKVYAKSEMEFSLDYNMDNLILPFDDFNQKIFYQNGKLLVLESSDKVGSSWFGFDQILFFYSDFTIVSINEIEEIDFDIYPNPVTDYLYIKNPGNEKLQDMSFVLFDTNGRIIEQNKFPANGRVNLSGLDNGLYFIEIAENNQRIYSQKVIKQ
jgi:hypothetical protein